MHKKIGAVVPEMFRNLFRKPDTELYPFTHKLLPARYRGKLDVDPERCTGCQVCALVCPAGVITMVDVGTRRIGDRELPVKRPLFDLSTCIFCGECVDNCAFNALEMTKQFELATSDKEDLLMDKAILE
jgi:formate hydrogenlyase subunit 6/NADH:ubiquinone oxidoreductase subunit I